MTGVGGSTGGVMFSPGKQQRLLYISDLTNNDIWFRNREDGKVVGQMGSMGEGGSKFFGLHMIAVDSKGNIRVALQKRTEGHRRRLIEQDPHLTGVGRRLVQAAGGKFDDGFHLFAVKPIEPFHDVVDIGSCFQVLKDS
jgi:hypothetical protein